MMLKTFLWLFLTVAVSLILLSCAGQVPPGGGPLDTTPPSIIYTEPDTNSINVETNRIVLEFSEYVDRRSAEESIFISPYVGQLEFDWSGRELTIMFNEPLRKNTTYVMNLGTDVIDIRARNRMAQGFTLAFSTGEKIDQGVIGGRVFDEKPEGIMMFAYALGGIDPDTLDPAKTKPDYIMQTGKDGRFMFSNIRFDSYRIFAVQDEYRNLIYDKQTDRFGVTTEDVTLSEERPQASNIWFRLSVEDTAKPFLTRAVSVSRTQLLLRFSEALDSASFRNASITLHDTTDQKEAGILLSSLERSDSTIATVLTVAPLDSGRAYRISVRNVFDNAGNPIDTVNSSSVFVATGVSDTISPKMEVVGIRDSSRGISLDWVLEVRFSEPVRQLPLSSAITLHDSAMGMVRTTAKWIGASSVLVIPDAELLSKSWYTLRAVMDSVRDYAGNVYVDSVRLIRFQTVDLSTTGVIEGIVAGVEKEETAGDIVVTVKGIGSNASSKTLRLPGSGKFKFDRLPEGQYTLDAYQDEDSSRTYSYGLPFPFQRSERFVVYPDTVKVRARWGVEGVAIKFGSTAGGK